jgi:glycine cleavage system H protein
MAEDPTDLRYTEEHQWVRPEGKFVTLGLTQQGADRLGAIRFAELPYPGELFKTGALFGRLSGETTSAAMHMPFVGHINAVNAKLSDSPGIINSDPYGSGWIVRIEFGDLAEVESLMGAESYAAFVAGQDS